MRALILAAGLGTRLRPITDTVPKPLVPVAGQPLLFWHLKALRKAGVHQVLINTHYLPEQVQVFKDEYKARFPEMDITLTYEPELLGSAGTLLKNKDYFQGGHTLVVYGDNLTNIDYDRLIKHHFENGGTATIAVYKEEHPESKGIVHFDNRLNITKFIEKPPIDQITSRHANAGIYVLSPDFIKKLDGTATRPYDFGRHVFPVMLASGQQLIAYPMQELLLDIGTVESYNKAQDLAKFYFHT